MTGTAQDAANKMKQAAQDAAGKVQQSAEGAWGTVKDTTQKMKETVVGKADASADSAKAAVRDGAAKVDRAFNSKKWNPTLLLLLFLLWYFVFYFFFELGELIHLYATLSLVNVRTPPPFGSSWKNKFSFLCNDCWILGNNFGHNQFGRWDVVYVIARYIYGMALMVINSCEIIWASKFIQGWSNIYIGI